jgi:hypothetical protein
MKPARTSRNYRLWIAIILILIGVGILFRVIYRKYQEYKIAKIRIEMQENILEGATAQPEVIKVNYAKQVGVGSPLVFGTVQAPDVKHTDVWNKIADVGVTVVRKDLFINYEVPNSTVENYRNNVNDIQNTATWRQSSIESVNTIYKNAKERGMKVMAILSYNPRWLTYSGDEYGVPKDWDVYEDIVKKSYTLHRQYIDYIEIWNEPTYRNFMKVKNTSITPVEAYTQLFIHAVKVIKKVDEEANDGKHVLVGGFVAHKPDETEFLNTFLSNEEVRKELNFISYHNYEHRKEPSWDLYNPILSKYGLSNIPIYLTEWNYTPEVKNPSEYLIGDKALSYAGSKLISFLNMGLAGANYYSIFPLEENSKVPGHGYLAFYRWVNNKVELLPQAKSWRILSKTLSLSKGPSKIMASEYPERINAVGGINSNDEEVVAIANTSDNPRLLEFQLKNLNVKKRARVYVYLASKEYDGTRPVRSELAEVKQSVLRTRFYMPEQSVAGIIVKQFNDTWFDFFDGITNTK